MTELSKDFMILQIIAASRWSEEALQNMPYDKVEQIYKDTVLRGS